MTRPILTDQSGTPLIGAGLPPARPRVVICCAQDWTRHEAGRKFARIVGALILTALGVVVCGLIIAGLIALGLGVQQ